jgi:hypothetical protein
MEPTWHMRRRLRSLAVILLALGCVAGPTGCQPPPADTDAAIPFDVSDAALACFDAPPSDTAIDGSTPSGCETLRFRATGNYRECAVGIDFGVTRCGTEIHECTLGGESTDWCGPLFDAGAPGRFIIGGRGGRLFFDGPPSPDGGEVLYWEGRFEVVASYSLVS